MSITREQVADLQPGDVVEVAETHSNTQIFTRGPLRTEDNPRVLYLGNYSFRSANGDPAGWFDSLTVVSRAPRPLYVNHPRTEPAAGDLVRDADGDVWHGLDKSAYGEFRWWHWNSEFNKWMHVGPETPTRPLLLLVDGETGQVVQ